MPEPVIPCKRKRTPKEPCLHLKLLRCFPTFGYPDKPKQARAEEQQERVPVH
jgi:hypothetical protein